MFKLTEKSWAYKLHNEFLKNYFKDLYQFVNLRRESKIIYPSNDEVFFCFNVLPFDKVRVVIIGQDPYCNHGQAHGLAFSSFSGSLPGSLLNIYKELFDDLGLRPSKYGNLINWARQGVLLLNTVLTVEAGSPGSHFNIGWEFFTNFVIKLLSESERSVIFLLWGRSAFEKSEFINIDKNIVFTAAHPSPMSAKNGFFGSRHFSKVNFSLKMLKEKEINWFLD